MQSANIFPQAGNTTDIPFQLREQQVRHRRTLQRRALAFWWPRVLIIVMAAIVAAILGPLVLYYPKPILVGIAAIIVVFFLVKRTDIGLLAMAVSTSAFFPLAFQVKSLEVYPALLVLVLLFFVVMVQAAFRVEEFVWPSFWAMWPQYGLILTAIVSSIMIQVTWVGGVPKRVSSSPIIYDELFAVFLYFLPLIMITIVTTLLTKRDKLTVYIIRAFLILACIAAAIVVVEFKRIGATIYTFRFTDPTIWGMKLKALAQLMGLGTMIAYAYCLYAKGLRKRIIFGALTVLCLLGVYFSLENSWWLEVGVALIVMTILFSRKLFAICCLAALPALPLVKAELAKLSTVKTADYYRLIIWQDMLRIWHMRPILGVGPGDLWNYDQHFTRLPRYLRDFSKTGLGVAHNGYLQILGEIGIVGEFFYIAFIVVFFYIAFQLFRRSNTPALLQDRILALVAMGLIIGSAVGDFTSGAFFLQPRQLGSASSLAQVLASWIVWGCVIYKDQVWRKAQKVQKAQNSKSENPAYQMTQAGANTSFH